MRTDRTQVVPILLTFVILLLVVLAAASTGSLSANPVLDVPAHYGEQPEPVPSTTADAAEPEGSTEPRALPGGLLPGALVLLAVGVLPILVRCLLRIRSRRGSTDREADQRPAHLQDTGTVHAVPARLPAWAEETRTALVAEEDTSDVVIRCWLDFERHCAEAGVGRAASQTTSDFAAAAAFSLDVPAQPLATLHRLYQRARFSRALTPGAAPLTSSDRDLAVTSIEELAAGFRTRPTIGANGTAR